MIPKEFKCAGFTIKVIEEDLLPDNDYGYYDDALNEIHLANYVQTNLGKDQRKVEITPEQKLNTFFHELIHCFNFYYNTGSDEALAQTFANFLCEYDRTKVYGEIVPA